MEIIRYETLKEDIDFSQPTIFLAGPTVRGNQPTLTSWRFSAIELFRRSGFNGTLIVPEFSDRFESDQHRFDLPQWEFFGLNNSHVNMFWIPRTRELIGLTTNFELGYWISRDRNKVIYGRPNDAYRMTYCDIMWSEDAKYKQKMSSSKTYNPCPIYNTLEKTVAASLQLLKQRHV